MNHAEELLHAMFRFGDQTGDVFGREESGGTRLDYFHRDVQSSMFGPRGTKEMLLGRDAYFDFVQRCTDALADRHDEILAITGIDEQCAFVHARAYRRSKMTGEEIRYEWAMLYRIENSRITYCADMLDADAQEFWGRVLG